MGSTHRSSYQRFLRAISLKTAQMSCPIVFSPMLLISPLLVAVCCEVGFVQSLLFSSAKELLQRVLVDLLHQALHFVVVNFALSSILFGKVFERFALYLRALTLLVETFVGGV